MLFYLLFGVKGINKSTFQYMVILPLESEVEGSFVAPELNRIKEGSVQGLQLFIFDFLKINEILTMIG